MDMNSFLLGTQYGNRGGGGGGSVPTPTSEDIGKVLSVGENLTPQWAEGYKGPEITTFKLKLPDLRDVEIEHLDTTELTSCWIDVLPSLEEWGWLPQMMPRGLEGLKVKRIWAANTDAWSEECQFDYEELRSFVEDIQNGKMGLLSYEFLIDDTQLGYLSPIQQLSNSFSIVHAFKTRNLKFTTELINVPLYDSELESMYEEKFGEQSPLFQIGLYNIFFNFLCVIEYERESDSSSGIKEKLTNENYELIFNKNYISMYDTFTSLDTLYFNLPDNFTGEDYYGKFSNGKIEIQWKNGATAPTIECSSDLFNYIPNPNTVSKVTFTLQEIQQVEIEEEEYEYIPVWRIDVEEISDPVNIKTTEEWTFTLEDGTTVTKNIISVTQSTTQGGDSNG